MEEEEAGVGSANTPIAPSQWLANQASTSALAENWPIHVILNPLDLDVFRPIDQSVARELLGLPQNARLIAFGAERPDADPRKGFDLFLEALRYIQGVGVKDTHCAIFGRADPGSGVETHLPVHWLGKLTDDLMLALVYSAADVTVVPSRQENLPQTATEAQACGCPVVAFDCTGLRDTVKDGVTGILARP
jgi:glycosyltransferase involved in cell wall biosynthesis